MINHRNKQNYRFRTWKFRDRCHLKGGVRQGCFLSLILNNLIQYIHFHSLYITSHYYAKFKENPCVGTDARPPLKLSSAANYGCRFKCWKLIFQNKVFRGIPPECVRQSIWPRSGLTCVYWLYEQVDWYSFSNANFILLPFCHPLWRMAIISDLVCNLYGSTG